MTLVLALTHQASVTLAEVRFLLIVFVGVWPVAAEIPLFKIATARRIVAGIKLGQPSGHPYPSGPGRRLPSFNPTADAAFSLNVCPERRVMVT